MIWVRRGSKIDAEKREPMGVDTIGFLTNIVLDSEIGTDFRRELVQRVQFHFSMCACLENANIEVRSTRSGLSQKYCLFELRVYQSVEKIFKCEMRVIFFYSVVPCWFQAKYISDSDSIF